MKDLKQKILKTIRLFVGLLLLPLLFCRCDMFLHKTADAEEYIRKNISKNPFVISDGKIVDGVKYWQVYFVDKPEFPFTVFSELYGKAGALIPEGYRIFTDFDNVFTKYYLIEYKKEYDSKLDIKVYDFIKYDGEFKVYDYREYDSKLDIKECDYKEYKYNKYQFNGYYSSAEEAHLLAKDIERFWNYIQKQPYPCEIIIECHYRIFIDGAERGYRIYIESAEKKLINAGMIEIELLKNIDNFHNAYQ